MALVTYHLIAAADETAFLRITSGLQGAERPLYLGRCQHWIHSPKTSLDALTGHGTVMQKWDFLLVTRVSTKDALALPYDLADVVKAHWGISAPAADDMLESLPSANEQREKAKVPVLPSGWSASEHSGLDASIQPPELEASLALESFPLGSPKTGQPVVLKDYIRDFGQKHPGPVGMFNIMASLPGQRTRLFDYFAAFTGSLGSRYAGDPQIRAHGVTDWSSRQDENAVASDPSAGGSGVWEDLAVVWYPSIWHFAKLLDDPDYAEADRKYKQGVLKDGPIMMVTEIKLE